jgi:tetratricopeptide (TPR) repeat protein
LGQAFDVIDYDGQAEYCYEQATRLEPSSPRWAHLLGLLQLQNDPEAATKHLARAAELCGDRPEAPRLRLAQALIERGQLDLAEKHLDKLFAAHPGNPAARVEKARVHLARNELTQAADILSPCLTNAYTVRPALHLLVSIYQRKGDTETANSLARSAAGMPRPLDWPDPYRLEVDRLRVDRQKLEDQVNSLLQQRRHAEAESLLERLRTTYPNDANNPLLVGRLRIQERKCDEAELALRRHLQLLPHSVNGLTQLAMALMCQRKWNDAIPILRQAITLKPDFTQAHYNLGICLARTGDSQGAIESYRQALRCTPGEIGSHVALAEELARLGRMTEARTQLENAARLDAKDPRVVRLRERFPAGP